MVLKKEQAEERSFVTQRNNHFCLKKAVHEWVAVLVLNPSAEVK